MHAAAVPAPNNSIRYSDQGSYLWLWRHAPCSWRENVTLRFADVPIGALSPAGCGTHPAVTAGHLQRLRKGSAIAPLVVCDNGAGGWYIHDGNHRYHAIREFSAGNKDAQVRIAIAVPNVGFRFVYRRFASYGTYLLEPVAPLLPTNAPLLFGRRTMVLVPHQDDETACAGLLQRIPDPFVVYATNGAPADERFWGRYGSREKYAAIRHNEARAALAKVGILHISFLGDHSERRIEFCDQGLYRVLPEALEAVSDVVGRYRPDTVLVPGYEGGHPDHDCCSFLGAQLRRHFGLSVWEMPLYHRSPTGKLVCQQFRMLNGTERAVLLSRKERQARDSMIAAYASQVDVPDFVSSGVEWFRPQAEYDYARPPHLGVVNYEVWQWPISANEVCRAFENCARTTDNVQAADVARCAPARQEQAALAGS